MRVMRQTNLGWDMGLWHKALSPQADVFAYNSSKWEANTWSQDA